MKRVEVSWLDSCALGRWVAAPMVRDSRSATCVSVGYLVDENDDAITIAQSVGEGEHGGDEYGHALTIPRAALCGEPVVLHAGRNVHGDA